MKIINQNTNFLYSTLKSSTASKNGQINYEEDLNLERASLSHTIPCVGLNVQVFPSVLGVFFGFGVFISLANPFGVFIYLANPFGVFISLANPHMKIFLLLHFFAVSVLFQEPLAMEKTLNLCLFY